MNKAKQTENYIKKSLGMFANQTNSTYCSYCDIGHYQDEKGQKSCIPCLIGTFCSVNGCKVCEDCDAGREARNEGSEKCTPYYI